MITDYISVKSVLYDLSITLDDRYYNEAKMTEWLVHGLRQVPLESMLIDKVALLEVVDHKTTLPSDFKFLTQMAVYGPSVSVDVSSEELALPENHSGVMTYFTQPWHAMRLTSSPYHNSICLNRSLYNCHDCFYTFSISPTLSVTTTLREGTVLVAYKGYPISDAGEILMPNSETLKEALLHYILYRYWMSKDQMKESGADQRMKFHLSMWSTLKKQSLSLNNPDVSQLENIKQITNRLVPRTEKFDQMFLTLTSP